MEAYAIIDVAGQQCRITAEAVLRVPRLEAEVGSEVTLDHVLLLSDGKKVHVGTPYVEGKAVQAEIVGHGKDAKVTVYKKKRRKNYRRKRGHRQMFTEILVKALPK
jgi:large subunit ribosomal protein L21